MDLKRQTIQVITLTEFEVEQLEKALSVLQNLNEHIDVAKSEAHARNSDYSEITLCKEGYTKHSLEEINSSNELTEMINLLSNLLDTFEE